MGTLVLSSEETPSLLTSRTERGAVGRRALSLWRRQSLSWECAHFLSAGSCLQTRSSTEAHLYDGVSTCWPKWWLSSRWRVSLCPHHLPWSCTGHLCGALPEQGWDITRPGPHVHVCMLVLAMKSCLAPLTGLSSP